MDNAKTQNPGPRAGGISVQTEHIFPIIKKWLYSEKDIFLREIVSNAADAITKMKRLISLGETVGGDQEYKIKVSLDKLARTLTVEDNGLGMTEDELIRYIGNIALSGALEFIEKYENTKGADTSPEAAGGGIIGHFGLGFYSAFMVSDKVEVLTKSHTGAPAVRWVCSGGGEYEITDAEREERGTSVIMHIAEDESEYLERSKIHAMLDKYCAFMPYDIYLADGANADRANDDGANGDDGKENKPLNTTSPLWLKRPGDCTDEEYREFYHKVFSDFNDPLFSIHINADYPLNFKGILYFPKLRSEFDSLEGQIKLYYNQVFVADNVKEIIPEYLIMLRGVIDCPELPLNVSRSYLQSNNYVAKVSAHIVKKIADKINILCGTNREEYERIWGDIRTFIEYAAIRDRKFFDRVKDSILLRLSDGRSLTVGEYRDEALARNASDGALKEGEDITVYYATDAAQQSQYIALHTAQGVSVALLDQFIDTQFITSAEGVYEKIKFVRVDADISALSGGAGEGEENKEIAKLLKKAAGSDKLEVRFEKLKDNTPPALLILGEEGRRMDDFMRAYSFMTKTDAAPEAAPRTLILNTSSPVYARFCGMAAEDSEKSEFMAGYLYKLALMAHRRLSAEELKSFLDDSYDILLGY